MNRRGFLGFIGAGAVAGPAVVKNVVGETYPITANTGIMNLLPRMGSGGVVGSEAQGGVLHALERITKLRRLISGEETEDADPWHSSTRKRITAEQHVHSLGSISKVSKVRIIMRVADELEREERRTNWMRELMRLQKLG